MEQRPVRDDDALYDPKHPTVKRADRLRYERAQQILSSRRANVVKMVALASLILWLVAGILVFPMMLAISSAIALGGFALGLAQPVIRWSFRWSREWTVESPSEAHIWRRILIAQRAFEIIVVIHWFALGGVSIWLLDWYAALVISGIVAGWLGMRRFLRWWDAATEPPQA